MRALQLLALLASTHAFPRKRQTSAAAIHRRKRRFVRGGAWGFGKGQDKEAEKADNATATTGGGMSQSQIDEALSVVPVFCLADPEGRPVLMTAPEDKDDATKKPLQAFLQNSIKYGPESLQKLSKIDVWRVSGRLLGVTWLQFAPGQPS